MKTVFYIGNFHAPNFNAAGKRVFGNTKILKDLGYKVVCIGNGMYKGKIEKDGILFYSIKKQPNFLKVMKNIKKTIELEGFGEGDTMILYGSLSISLLTGILIRFAHKNKFRVIVDCPDWLNNTSNNLLFNVMKKIDYELEKRVINKRADGIILISDYLKDYYKKNRTVVIPPLNLYNDSHPQISDGEDKKLCYAGIPFRLNQKEIKGHQMKDRLDIVIDYLYEVYKECKNFVFDVYGVTKEQYLYAVPRHEEICSVMSNIKFHGKIDFDDVQGVVSKSDFTILFRDKTRETMAGFSTKISESLSLFTPVITNDTSDIRKYIDEGKNGYIIDLENKEQCVKKIIEILNSSKENIKRMKEYNKENQKFYYRNYLSEMKEITEGMKI